MTQELGTSTVSTVYTYNSAGQLVSTVDGDLRTDSYTYDADGRVVSELLYSNSTALVESMSFSYDSGGNMLTAFSSRAATHSPIPSLTMRPANVTSVSEPFGVSISFGYNKAGQRTSVSDSFGGSETLGYDGAGNLTTLKYSDASDNLSINFTYNQADQQTGETMYSSGTLIATVSETYDGAGNVLSIVETSSSSATYASFSYVYDKANELLSETDYLAGSATTTTSYSYDAQGELISAGTQHYSFNLAGDPNGSGDSITYGNELTNFVDPATTHTLSYTYDSVGNEVSKVDGSISWTFTYNNANQISTVTETNTSLAQTLETVSDEYDAFGNLVKETVTPYTTGTAGTAVVTEFAVDGWNPAKAGAIGQFGLRRLGGAWEKRRRHLWSANAQCAGQWH